MQVNSCHLLLISVGVMGGVDPDLDLGPPLVELLGRPIIGLRGHNNFLNRNEGCSTQHNICLMGEELGKCGPKVLLVLNELLDHCFPIHG